MTTIQMVDQEYLELDPDLIDPHPLNPNRGDEEALRASVEDIGFYGVVYVRFKPEDGRYELIAGEHRWRLLKAAGKVVPAVMLNLDYDTALKALLADNEVTRRGRYDNERLVKALRALPSVSGTGFDLEALEAHEEARKRAEERKKVKEEVDAEGGLEAMFERQYGIVIHCSDEASQEALFNQLQTAGVDPARMRALSI